uniref:Fluoride-specific ion channel FluC n=1 Tax=Candidatus Methanogaster sp. ANME-2c ERB4 TaxID=2759911 RepID=A0A7G9YNG7_9EURY|nr:putative fluoride ion transporter CrcB [Methanosarcinales archaeon ANME-2c ERB4]
MSKLLFIAIGGAIGALLRYALSGVAYKYIGSGFPWGTLCVNLIGAFAIGILWGLSEQTTISSDFRTFAFIGILGSFTTFSTYALETVNLFRDGEIKLALANVLITNVLGIALVISGFIASKYLMITIDRRL